MSVGQFTAYSAGWLILFVACCTNRSELTLHAANSSKPPAPTPKTGSRNFRNRAWQNCSLLVKNLRLTVYIYWKRIYCTVILLWSYLKSNKFFSSWEIQTSCFLRTFLKKLPAAKFLGGSGWKMFHRVGNTASGGGEGVGHGFIWSTSSELIGSKHS